MNAFLMALFITVAIGLACQTAPPALPEPEVSEEQPDQEAWNTAIHVIQNSRQQAIIQAGRRSYYHNKRLTIIREGVQVEFFDKDGGPSSTLSADSALLEENPRRIRVYGHVVINSPKYGRVETDSLRWDEDAGLIVTDAPVRITTDRDTLSGRGFEADTALRQWKIRRDVRGRFDRSREMEETFDEEP